MFCGGGKEVMESWEFWRDRGAQDHEGAGAALAFLPKVSEVWQRPRAQRAGDRFKFFAERTAPPPSPSMTSSRILRHSHPAARAAGAMAAEGAAPAPLAAAAAADVFAGLAERQHLARERALRRFAELIKEAAGAWWLLGVDSLACAASAACRVSDQGGKRARGGASRHRRRQPANMMADAHLHTHTHCAAGYLWWCRRPPAAAGAG